MKRTFSVMMMVFVMVSMAPTAMAAGSEGGQDVNPEGEVPFSVLERTTPSQDGVSWNLSVELAESAKENGTSLELTTQICLNSGVCDPPVTHDVAEENGVYTMSLKPPEDHSYVNWRVKATYDDDSKENFPDADWYKTWSTCYYQEGGYGGVHADGDGCDVPAAGGEEEALPALGAVVAVGAVGVAAAAVVIRRR
jgi:hypothetical protein